MTATCVLRLVITAVVGFALATIPAIGFPAGLMVGGSLSFALIH